MQLAVANRQNELLIEKLTSSKIETTPKIEVPQQIIQTRHVPFSVKRQQLEAESRLRAQELRQKVESEIRSAKPDIIKPVNTEIKALETELNIPSEVKNA